MADDLKNIVDNLKTAGENAGETKEQIARLVEEYKKLGDNNPFGNFAKDAEDARNGSIKLASALTPIRDEIEKIRATSGRLSSSFGTIAAALYNTTNASMDAGEHFEAAFNKNYFGVVIGGIDEVTKLSREFRSEAIKIGSEFGLGFDGVSKTYQSYAGAILLAQQATFANRKETEQSALELAQLGVSLDEISKTIVVAGEKQNLLTEGFRLAQDSGLKQAKVFNMMGIAARKMGLSVEDAAKPILSLESLAKSTGLPISQLSDRIFDLATKYSRFGMNVESLSPILRRFTSVLGDGFKGLAIDDTMHLVQGLTNQVNTTNAAFMAMQSGMARPGAGVAGAMLDYEDAMAEPEKAMKMLASSLSNISGGKILTINDAHKDEASAVQFKLQRDMLSQLTGINDPQQTRTLMALLSAQQSGKALTAEENKTLADAMKSGADKQEEQRSLAEKIGKAQVGLLTQIALDMSNAATRILPPQTASGLINRGASAAAEYSDKARDMASDMLNKAIKFGDDFFTKNTPAGIKKAATAVENFSDDSKNQILRNPIQRISPFTSGEQPLVVGGAAKFQVPQPATTPSYTQIPAPVALSPVLPSAINPVSSTNTQIPASINQQNNINPQTTNFIITFRGNDDLTRAIANSASIVVNKSLHGNS